MTTRIAILLTNNDNSPFSLRFPHDGHKVAGRLAVARPRWQCRVWSAKDGEFPTLEDADAFIITGSPASVNDSLSWITRLTGLIQEIDEFRKPLIGLCFGHQIIAKALGGEVQLSKSGWRFGAIDTDFFNSQAWMIPTKSRLRLYASHSEQVTRLPHDATLLGSAIDCPNASFGVGSHILTTQYHPEFDQSFMKALALEYQGEVADDVLKRGETELDLATDGAAFFDWIVQFIARAPL